MRRQLQVFAAAALACIAPVACNDGGNDAGGTGPPTPSIEISVSTSELAVMCGSSGNATITLRRLGGFTGAVTITLDGLPGDVVATLEPVVLSGAATVTVVTIDASAALPGSYPITVTASSSIGQASASYRLSLVEPPDYTISIEPKFELMRGQTPFLLPITVTRTGGFEGPVTLSLPGAPEGIFFDFIPPVVTGTSAQLSLGAKVTAPLGTVTLTITGTAPDLQPRQAALVLTVTREEVTLSAAPPSITIARGGTGVVTIGIERAAGNADAVEFLLYRPPDGIAGVFTPPYATGSSATLTLSVDSTVTPGAYPLKVLGEYGYFVFAEVVINVVVVERVGLWDFAISIEPKFELMRGQTPFLLPITVTRTGGFEGPVTLSLPGAPEGIFFDFIPPVVTGTSAQLSLGAGMTAPLGTVTLTVTGSAANLPPRQAVVALTVTKEQVTLSATPPSVTIARGGTGVVTIGIERAAGNADAVEFFLPSTPPGITGFFTPPNPTGSSATLTLSVASSVPAGAYPFIVRGEYGYFVFTEVRINVVVVDP